MTSRESNKYSAWRKEVKKRDGRYCQWPDCRKVSKEVHHIIPFAKDQTLRVTPENGISLCHFHHRLIKNKENDYVLMFMDIVTKTTKAYKERQKRKKNEF